jgi:hypothetical protein
MESIEAIFAHCLGCYKLFFAKLPYEYRYKIPQDPRWYLCDKCRLAGKKPKLPPKKILRRMEKELHDVAMRM